MNLGRFLILIACICHPLANSAWARGKDYTWIINNLRASGVSPSSIRWADVETLCLPFKPQDSDHYQHCKLEKALLQADYGADATSCNDTARSFHPNNLRYQTVIVGTSLVPTPVNTTLTYLNTTPAVADGAAFERHLFDRCMSDKGWRNPRNYHRGRAERSIAPLTQAMVEPR